MLNLAPLKLDEETKKSLQDLSQGLKEVTQGLQGWCYKYRPKEEIGKVIYDNFITYNEGKIRGKDKKEKENKFIFSDELPQSGILSQLQGFQVLAGLIEDFNVPFDEKEKARLLSLLDGILERLENGFDATPYLESSNQFKGENKEEKYVDTVTWFLSCACSVFRLMIQKELVIGKAREERLVRLFCDCLAYLNKSSFIQSNKDGKFTCGWNYAQGCDEPSLYFTFAVSEVLIDIYSTFEHVIATKETELVQKQIDETFAKEESEERLAEIQQKKAQIAEKNLDFIKKYNKNDKDVKEEKRLFALINSGYDVFAADSPYATFEQRCKDAANCIWPIVKDKLTAGFFNFDLSDVSEEVIEQSITSDALFNSIFAINTVINAGLDEDAEDKISYYTLNGTAAYQNALDDYDDMRDTIRGGYDNVFRMYNKLRKSGKDYKVNEYLLSFGEHFPDDKKESVAELRKARIRAFSLMPLLVKTKTVIGQFVVRYPQYDMQIYLERILDSRYVDKYAGRDRTWWIWEKDGYSSSSNYYFVSALSEFYQYYEEYEDKYSYNAAAHDEVYDKAKREAEIDQLRELRTSGEIYQLTNKLKEAEEDAEAKKAEIAALNEKAAALQDKLDHYNIADALGDLIRRIIKEGIVSMLSEAFLDMAKGITEDGKQRAVQKREKPGEAASAPQERTQFEASLRKLGLALISEQLFGTVYDDKSVVNNEKEFSALQGLTAADLDALIALYAKQILKSDASEFVRTVGYEGIVSVLEQKEKSDDKKRRD